MKNDKNAQIGQSAVNEYNEKAHENLKVTVLENGDVVNKLSGQGVTPYDLFNSQYTNILLKPVTESISDLLNNAMSLLFGFVKVREVINQLYVRKYVGTTLGQDFTNVATIEQLNPADPTTYESIWRVNQKRVYSVSTSHPSTMGTSVSISMIGELIQLIVKRIKDAKFEEWSNKTAQIVISNTGNHNLVVDSTAGPDGTTPATPEDLFECTLLLAKQLKSPIVRSIPGLTDTTLKMNNLNVDIMYSTHIEATMEAKVLTKLFHDEYVKNIASVNDNFNFKDIDPNSGAEIIIVTSRGEEKKFELIETLEQALSQPWPMSLKTIHMLHYWADLIADARIPSIIIGKGLNETSWGQTNLTAPNALNVVSNIGTVQFRTLKQIFDAGGYSPVIIVKDSKSKSKSIESKKEEAKEEIKK